MTFDKPLSQAAIDDEQEHLERVAEDLAASVPPPRPDVVRARQLDAALESALGNVGAFVGKAVEPLQRRINELSAADAKHNFKHAAAHSLIEQLVERVSRLEDQVTLKFVGVWEAGSIYKRGSLATHDGSLWFAITENDKRPGTSPGDWVLAVKRGRDGKDAR